MGNKPTYFDGRPSDLENTQGRNLRKHLSEEDYLPMTLDMKKTILEGNKFRHVSPSERTIQEEGQEEEIGCCAVKSNEFKNIVEDYCVVGNNYIPSSNKSSKNFEEKEKEEKEEEEISNTYCLDHNYINIPPHIEFDESYQQIDPVVTIINRAGFSDRSASRTALIQSPGKSLSSQEHNVILKDMKLPSLSPTSTNRRYSLIDLRTGLKKSRFTLQLEERLRQSKLELGFDTDLDEWREFSYTENPEGRKRVESIHKGKWNVGKEEHVGKGLEKVLLKDPLQYCSHNCQILGLCSIRPEVYPKTEVLENLVFKDDINGKHEMNQRMESEEKHPKRENCQCDLCTLAYLTDLGFPEEHHGTPKSVDREKNNEKSGGNQKGHRNGVKEMIKILDPVKGRRSIEVTVPVRKSTCESLNIIGDSSLSNLSTSSFGGDCTNRKIRKMFYRNNVRTSTVKEIYKNPRRPNVGVSIVNLSSDSHGRRSAECSRKQRTKNPGYITSADLRQSLVFQKLNSQNHNTPGVKESSSTVEPASKSSSLSTIMSYKRVRQLFQTIIEKNRSRKKSKKNINKFKEMEELGLGEVVNNRWYPSGSKTLSIWSDINHNVQGVQAQFRKYPKRLVSDPPSFCSRLDP